jgi:anthraniloyl-CoA monooxygenase
MVADNQDPEGNDREDMDRVRGQFVAAPKWPARAGFDMIELHCAHGYLMSSFITPLTNRRDRRVWRQPGKPHALSAGGLPRHARGLAGAQADCPCASPPMTGWAPTGVTPEDAVEIARMLKAAGADIIDVSAGPDLEGAKPVYGRMFQTPFSDRIRNEADMATMAVGNIYEPIT